MIQRGHVWFARLIRFVSLQWPVVYHLLIEYAVIVFLFQYLLHQFFDILVQELSRSLGIQLVLIDLCESKNLLQNYLTLCAHQWSHRALDTLVVLNDLSQTHTFELFKQ